MKQYVVDAFTDTVFSGNPAAVCVMDEWLQDDIMLKIAKENNLSETAFTVKEQDGYTLRWFTPGGEIDLCGHATLAAAYVIMNFIESEKKTLSFSTLSGSLTVDKKDDLYKMNFPAYTLSPVTITKTITEAVGAVPVQAFMGRDLLCVFDNEDTVKNLAPNMEKLTKLDGLLVHATAPGRNTDCVSRSFAPKLNVSEDPVCGSGHCHIIPYWSNTLKKTNITAYQASERSGTLYCSFSGTRVTLAGKAVLYSAADIYIHSHI